MRNVLRAPVWRSMRMILFRASLRDEVAIVLQHVQVIVLDNALDLFCRISLRSRDTQINRLPLELLRLPIQPYVIHQPIADGWIVNIQSPRSRINPSLAPIHPHSKPQTTLMCLIRKVGQPVRKLPRIRIPVAHTAKPPCIQMKHLQPELFRVRHHPQRQRLIHLHSTAPAVAHHQRILRIGPCAWIRQYGPYPPPQLIAALVDSTDECAKKYLWCLEARTWFKPGAERPELIIQAECASEPVAVALKRDPRSSTEFDARIPSRLRTPVGIDELNRNDLPCLPHNWMRVGARAPHPPVAFVNRFEMRSLRRRGIRALLDIQVPPPSFVGQPQIHAKTIQQR